MGQRMMRGLSCPTSVNEGSIILGYSPASEGNQITKFRDKVVTSS